MINEFKINAGSSEAFSAEIISKQRSKQKIL